MNKILTEGLSYHDMVNQVDPVIAIDEYEAHIGDNDEIVTVSFTVKSQACGEDLSDWLEKGYDWVLDAEVSTGELRAGRYAVFVEMNRRSRVPERIMEILSDLNTLTDIPVNDWRVRIGDEKETHPCTEDYIREHVLLSPHEYRKDHEQELNEWREIVGIPTVSTYENDEPIKAIKRQAGIE